MGIVPVLECEECGISSDFINYKHNNMYVVLLHSLIKAGATFSLLHAIFKK